MTPPRLEDDIEYAFRSHAKAYAAFRDLPPSHQHEYIKWIDQAKQPATRARRIHKCLVLLRDHHAQNE